MPQVKIIRPFDTETVGNVIVVDELHAEQLLQDGFAELISAVEAPTPEPVQAEEPVVEPKPEEAPVEAPVEPETKVEVAAEGA